MVADLKRFKRLLEKGLPVDYPDGDKGLYALGFGLFDCWIDSYHGALFFSFRLYDKWDLYKLKAYIDHWLKSVSGYLDIEYSMLADDLPKRRGKARVDFKKSADIHAIVF